MYLEEMGMTLTESDVMELEWWPDDWEIYKLKCEPTKRCKWPHVWMAENTETGKIITGRWLQNVFTRVVLLQAGLRKEID